MPGRKRHVAPRGHVREQPAVLNDVPGAQAHTPSRVRHNGCAVERNGARIQFDQSDQEPTGKQSTEDAEAVAAVEVAADDPVYADLPVLQKTDLAPEWQGEYPVLCIAGRTLLDEAAAIMVAQLCTIHGLAARVEGPDALSTANIFRLETSGVALVCLSYLDTTNAAHIRYAVRRIRRKLPLAIIMVGCWALTDDGDRLNALREGTKADLFCSSFREATQLCVEAAKLNDATIIKSQTVEFDALSNLKQETS